MKKTLLILLSCVILVVGALAIVPVFFKDQLVHTVSKSLNESLEADVLLDPDALSVSLFSHFPTVSVGVSDLGIIGREQFKGDTLAYINQLDLSFNLISLIFDETPSLNGIYVEGATVYVKVLEDGTANYDIVKTSETPEAEAPSTEQFKLGINTIQIDKLDLMYEDHSLQTFLTLEDAQGKGSGEFSETVFELPISLQTLIKDLNYEGTSYLSDKQFKGQTTLGVDLDQMKFTFGQGEFSLNEFLFNIDGSIALPEEGIGFDIDFSSPKNDFKNLLSLVPGMYTQDFRDLKSDGEMAFNGFFKGMYSELQFPDFEVNLDVSDGMFQYSDLPLPVKDINLKFQAKNEGDQLETTRINLPVFSMLIGANPINGTLSMSNLSTYDLDGTLNGKLNLDQITDVFPIDGTELGGLLDFEAKASGRFSEVEKKLPKIDAKFNFKDGRVKNEAYPTPLENIHAEAFIQNPGGTMQNFELTIPSFGFVLEGEQIEGNLKISDFEKLNWDGAIVGALDLKKLTAILPIEDTQVEGIIQADFKTNGSYADIEKSRYDQVRAEGTMDVKDIFFVSKDYPQGIKIQTATLAFSPERADLSDFKSVFGKSPLEGSGYLSNYMGYLFSEKGILTGNLNLTSSKFDVNEWMSADGSDESVEDEPLEVIPLPENLDFRMNFASQEVLYDNLSLKEVTGALTLKNGILEFSDAGMKALNGIIRMKGTYDPRDISAPTFNFNLDLSQLEVASAFEKFTTVKAFAPIAKDVTGKLNSALNFSGTLGSDMMPILSSINATGILEILDAALQGSPLLQKINGVTKLKENASLALKNVKIPLKIENGTMEVQPFDVKLWDYQATVQGTAGFDGTMNYLVNMLVPAGKFGSQANSLLSQISNTDTPESSMIPIALTLGGTYAQPSVGLAGGNSIENLLTNALKSRANQEKEAVQEKIESEIQTTKDSLKTELKAKAETLQDSLKQELKNTGEKAGEKVVNEAKSLLNSFIKKKKPAKPDSTDSN